MFFLWNILRVLVAGILLGIVVGRLAAENPWHFHRLSPKYWRRVWRHLTQKERYRIVTIGLWTGVFALVLALCVNWILIEANVPVVNPEEYPFVGLEERYPWVLLLIVNILPIFEEWIFRGILIDEFITWKRSRLGAVLFSSLLFSIFHLSNPGTYPAFALAIFPTSLLLGVCYLRAGLGGAVLAHNLYNSCLVLFGMLS